MPEVRVYIPTPFRRVTGGEGHVTASGATLRELIDALEQQFPGFSGLVLEEGELRHYVNVYVGGDEVRSLGGVDTPLADGAEIAFVPMLAGGESDPAELRLEPGHRQAMIEHALELPHEEVCGLLAGGAGHVREVIRMANTERSPFAYVMDPKEQLQVELALDEKGYQQIGIYHSHTRSPAYPSATDIGLSWEGQVYVIVSLQDRANPDLRAFLIPSRNGQPIEIPVVEVSP